MLVHKHIHNSLTGCFLIRIVVVVFIDVVDVVVLVSGHRRKAYCSGHRTLR